MDLFNRFASPLKQIEDKISFWLFQMPESFLAKEENMETIKNFFMWTKLGEKAVIEFRHKSWWKHVKEI